MGTGRNSSSQDTKQRLVDGVLEVVRQQGITAVSARSVASAAGANQALVFYHFGSVEELVAQACLSATEARVALYRRVAMLGATLVREQHELLGAHAIGVHVDEDL